MMNHRLIALITTRLSDAANFVNTHMPINIDINAIYEGLIGEPHVAAAFAEAAKYLPPANFNGTVNVQCGGHTLQLGLSLASTDKYPVFLMPRYEFKVNSESEFGRALALPVRVATEWEMLKHVWDKLVTNVDDMYALGIVLPWLSPLLLGVDDVTIGYIRHKTEREDVRRQLAALHRGNVPKMIPTMSSRINTVCKSGKQLLSQYRMIEASADADAFATPRVRITNIPSLLPEWLFTEMDEVVADWNERQRQAQTKAAQLRRKLEQ